MTPKVVEKWRPTLTQVVFVVLTTVMILPLIGFSFFRLYENQLVRQTESELIAQGAVLSAALAHQVKTANVPVSSLKRAAEAEAPVDDRYSPIEPTLDLARDEALGPRPGAVPADHPSDPAFLAIGDQMQAIVLQSQRTTLAGFRVLDPHGVVISGREERGLSLAHVEEIKAALQGRYHAVLRTRISDQPPPPVYSISRGTGIRIFVAMPAMVDGRVAGVVYVSRTPSNIIKYMYSERRKFALAGLAILGATIAIGFIFSRAITRPIHALVHRTTEIGRGNREALSPLDHYGTREIALLSQSFIDMAQRLHDRSDYISTFATHVSHELKTPLTSIQGAAELLRDDCTTEGSMEPNSRQRFLDNIIADTRRLTAMLHRLRELARADTLQDPGRCDLARVVTDLRPAFPEVEIEYPDQTPCPVAMTAENTTIIFSHLIDNAARHGAKTVAIRHCTSDGWLAITVRDDGPGISQKNRDKVFEAFFTTRRETGGTGMGLGIVQAILRSHGGSIRLLDSDHGAMFEIKVRRA